VGYVYGVTSTLPYVLLRKRVIEPLWESWPDWKIFTELARRMGYGEYFPWNTEEEVVAHLLEPCQVSIEQLKEKPHGAYYGVLEYDAYQRIGFGTPSKKVEIYSETLEQYGHDPLPTHHEPTQSPISSPELAKEYPLILISGARMLPYTHSQLRNVVGLRRLAPDPLVEIHPSTARKFDITDGEMVAIETKKGSIKVKAKVTEDIAPQVVSIPHGWAQANVNILTDLDLREPITGYPERNAVLCRVKKI
jgi:anaerobic selenocysteine-containing dehydrogenase